MQSPLSVGAMIQRGQFKFLQDGGLYALPLEHLRERGIIDREYVFREFPKVVERGDVSLTVASREEERRLTLLLERAEELGVSIPEPATFEALEHHVGLAEDLAGKRAAKQDPKAAARARLQRMQAEMERLEAELGDDGIGSPIAEDAAPDVTAGNALSAASAPATKARPRRDLPVVAD